MNMQHMMRYAGIIVVIMALFLSGCGVKVQTLTYDKPIQENQSAVLIIPNGYTVTNFDGQHVKWTTSPSRFSLSGTHAAIRLPSGKHSISYSYYQYMAGLTTYEHYSSGAVVQKTGPSRTISFDGNITINMESGKRYKFEGRRIVITSDNYDQLP